MTQTFILVSHVASSAGISALGFSLSTFLIQLVTFIFIFIILMRFAVKPIVLMLEKRRQTLEEGVRAGEELAQERAKLKEEVERVLKDARRDADHIIETGQKEARDIVREAEGSARRRTEALMADAELRITEETERAKRGLEKEVVSMVSEATEAIVEEKVDAKKDAQLIEKSLRKRAKQ